MSKHTPGPWTTHVGTVKICSTSGEHIATMRATCVNGRWEADANLMTAAPELAEEIESMRDFVLALLDVYQLTPGDAEAALHRMSKSGEVLRKALGEEPRS